MSHAAPPQAATPTHSGGVTPTPTRCYSGRAGAAGVPHPGGAATAAATAAARPPGPAAAGRSSSSDRWRRPS
eukprot:612833-Prorocentrum_minimum.AAC.1